MERSEIKNRVVEISTEKLGLIPGEIDDDSDYQLDLGADSLDFVELIMEFEKEFNIAIPDDQAEQATKICEMVSLIDGLIHK